MSIVPPPPSLTVHVMKRDVECVEKWSSYNRANHWNYINNAPIHSSAEYTDRDVQQVINGTKVMGGSPFVNNTYVGAGMVDFDLHKSNATEEDFEVVKQQAIKYYKHIKSKGVAVVLNISSGQKGWHIRVLAPNLCEAPIMRAFLTQALKDCDLPLDTEVFPKQSNLKDTLKGCGSQIKFILSANHKTKLQSCVFDVENDKLLNVTESLIYLQNILDNINDYNNPTATPEMLKLIEKPVFKETNIENMGFVPDVCPVMNEFFCKIELPQGKHLAVDPQAGLYLTDKPELKRNYMIQQGRSSETCFNLVNNGQHKTFNCGAIRKYLRTNEHDTNCSAALNVCSECKYFKNFINEKKDSNITTIKPIFKVSEEIIDESNDNVVMLPCHDNRICDFSKEVAKHFKGNTDIFYKINENKIVEIVTRFDKILNKDVTMFSELTTSRLINLIEKKIITTRKDKFNDLKRVSPTKNIVEIMMSNDDFINSLNPISRFLKFPLTFVRDGKLIIPKKGFDPRFDTYFTADTPEIKLMDVNEAKELINKILDGFCFKEPIDRIITIAYLLTPACRGCYSRITARTPLFLIKANRERAGKDFLAGVVGIIYENKAIENSPICDGSRDQNNNELRKKVTSSLIQGQRRFHSSNNKGFLNNAVFEQILTSENIRDRILGGNKEIELDNEMDFSLSANWGLTYTPDLWHRSRAINLFFSEENPNNRVFPIEDLHGFVKNNRDKILSAITTLIKSWVDNGMIPCQTKFSSFPEWARVIGGIMNHHNLGDPCVNLDDDGIGGDKSTEDMKVLFEIMYGHCNNEMTKNDYLPSEIFNLINDVQDEYQIFTRLDLSITGGRTSLGKQLVKFIGRELGGILLTVDNSSPKKARWQYNFKKVTGGNVGNIGNLIPIAENRISRKKVQESVENVPNVTNVTTLNNSVLSEEKIESEVI